MSVTSEPALAPPVLEVAAWRVSRCGRGGVCGARWKPVYTETQRRKGMTPWVCSSPARGASAVSMRGLKIVPPSANFLGKIALYVDPRPPTSRRLEQGLESG